MINKFPIHKKMKNKIFIYLLISASYIVYDIRFDI